MKSTGKTGAGAATSSGINYQNRVGALILGDDCQFDDFAADAEDNRVQLIVDPLVDLTGKPNFISGIPIRSMKQLVDRSRGAHGTISE